MYTVLRHNPPGSDTKDFISYSTINGMNFIIKPVPSAAQVPWGDVKKPPMDVGCAVTLDHAQTHLSLGNPNIFSRL
jgi:hypothetical protein